MKKKTRMMIRPWRHLTLSVLACLVLADCSAAEDPRLAGFSFTEPDEVIMLGPALREVSGLALSAGGNLIAHNDERGIVYELDLNTRTSVVDGLLSGGRHVKGDFEGVATHGDDTWLVTSNGYISHFRRSDNENVSVYNTGLKSVCEIEGMAHDPVTSHLLLACKETYTEDLKGKVALFRWSLENLEREAEPLAIPRSEIKRVLGTKKFHPSGITLSPDGERYLVLSSRPKAIIEVSRTGNVLAGIRLSKAHHLQPEGIAFLNADTLVIADEGKKSPGRLSLYRRAKSR